VPNSDHSLSNTDASLIDAISGLFGWYLAIVEGRPRPAISWQPAGREIVVQASPPPLAARLWRARNPEARDFRLDTIGEAWRATELSAVERGTYAVRVASPPTGWKAFFVELAYPSSRPGLCQVYSTPVFVTPEVRPFEGMQPPMAWDGPVTADAGLGAAAGAASLRPAALLDEIFDHVGEEVHEEVLERVAGDLGKRAIRYCFARDLDDLEEAAALYVRLGFGQSVEDFLEDRLEDLWRDARRAAKDLIDDVIDLF